MEHVHAASLIIGSVLAAAPTNPFLPVLDLIVGWIMAIRPSITVIALVVLGIAMWAHMQAAKAIAISTAVALIILWAAPAIATALEAAK